MSNGDEEGVLRVLVVITRGERGGAQVHVRDLLVGLQGRAALHLAVGEEGFLADEARTIGVPVHPIPALQREVAPRRDAAATRALLALARRIRPHLVHTHSTKAGLLGRLVARRLHLPAIHTAHSWSFSDGISWRRKAFAIPLEAAAGRWTDRFIAVSAADREVGLRYRVADDARVVVVHNGVADTSLRARPDRPGVPVLVMVARLAAPKDPLLLLQALEQVRAPCRLRLVGDGPDRGAVEDAVARLGIEDRVELLGTRRDIDAILADAQVGVLVSRQEGFPLVVLEAMRAGLPVVASDVGGVSEAVEHERTGLLVPRGDGEALRAALERLSADPGLRAAMGRAGRSAYEARFTVQRMVEGTAEVYADVARRHGLPALRRPQTPGRP
ncbi:MAG: glycosyltransferase family 1 protein [Deltaproteobacteria bacterium]|nr:MAG: glycosyltransferase family 1 protein [Deltaproteobacteria bacterium]